GVIAASAGNHALGVAYHGKLLDVPVTVVMPKSAPLTKVVNCRQMGARVILEGNNYEEARLHANRLRDEQGLTLIHGFDDRAVSYAASLKEGRPVLVPIQPTLADGLAVPQVGGNAFEIARELVDRVVIVKERDIALAVLRLAELEKSVVEGAGAAPLAACLAQLVPELAGRKVVLPLCGGNIDTTILGR